MSHHQTIKYLFCNILNYQYIKYNTHYRAVAKKVVMFIPVDSCHGTTIVMSYCTIVTSGHHGNIRTFTSNNNLNSITQTTCNMTYTWLPVLLLPPSGYSIQGTENCIFVYFRVSRWHKWTLVLT